jgi:hypothetical protein
MDLATCQRKLLALFRNTYILGEDDDAYIRTVAQSKELEEGRKNILLWRIFVLERTCPLTVNLLRRRDLLEEILEAFIRETNISPFRETQGPAFLERMSNHDDRLIAAVAQFELALMNVRLGDSARHVIHWDMEPHGILYSLAQNTPFASEIPQGPYDILVARDLPGQFKILSGRAMDD